MLLFSYNVISSKNVGTTSDKDWHEEKRSVEELLVHPHCDPGNN